MNCKPKPDKSIVKPAFQVMETNRNRMYPLLDYPTVVHRNRTYF